MRLVAVRDVGDVGRARHFVFCWIRGCGNDLFGRISVAAVYEE